MKNGERKRPCGRQTPQFKGCICLLLYPSGSKKPARACLLIRAAVFEHHPLSTRPGPRGSSRDNSHPPSHTLLLLLLHNKQLKGLGEGFPHGCSAKEVHEQRLQTVHGEQEEGGGSAPTYSSGRVSDPISVQLTRWPVCILHSASLSSQRSSVLGPAWSWPPAPGPPGSSLGGSSKRCSYLCAAESGKQ